MIEKKLNRAKHFGADGKTMSIAEVGEYVEVKVNGIRNPVVAEVTGVDLKEMTLSVSIISPQPDGREFDHFEKRRLVNVSSSPISLTGRIFKAIEKRHARRK